MFERFKQRSYELERLDTGDYTAAEYARWQREMQLIHRLWGETRALRNSLFRDLGGRTGRVSILDVGAGSGELLRELGKWFGGRASLFGVEINETAARSIKGSGAEAVMADGLRLPFETNSFDAVFCSLFLHHLGDADASQLIAEMARVSRGRIYAIDLNRDPIAYYFYRTIGRLFLQRLTVEDGALSVLRSFTADELLVLAERARLRNVRVERSRVNRLILSGTK
jgi:ubiquinone/menaquinone biosynthesis C-methylase UbiE